ncbi:MAG TPA: hypothetical protein VHZ28_07615 [Terracidiphilus sp.]|jgi:hypothetical protein|nr:hypothetical protein [Terracidiphilus sp.]
MRKTLSQWVPLALAAAFLSPLVLTGCGVHAGYYDDPYYHDRHVWNGGEVVYYNQWEHDTRHEHRDFKKRNDADKKAYWDWRHSHEDHH